MPLLHRREGCAGSWELRTSLEEALDSIEPRPWVAETDVMTLPGTDHRTGYGTPTILVNGEDLMGAPSPAPATPT